MLINLLGFNVIWAGLVMIGDSFILAALSLLVLHFYYYANRQKEWRLMLSISVIGILVDSLLTQFGIFVFVETGNIPYWLMALWLAFACTISHSLSYLARSKYLQFIVGSLIAPLSYIAGERLDAVAFQYPLVNTYLVLAIVWGPLLVLFFTIEKKINRGVINYG